MSDEIPDPVRELLTAVLEAMDIPHAATIGDAEVRDQIVKTRTMHAVLAIRSALTGSPVGIQWTTEYLRERLAEEPPTGYVTSEQAQAALAEGKSWSEAVAK